VIIHIRCFSPLPPQTTTKNPPACKRFPRFPTLQPVASHPQKAARFSDRILAENAAQRTRHFSPISNAAGRAPNPDTQLQKSARNSPNNPHVPPVKHPLDPQPPPSHGKNGGSRRNRISFCCYRMNEAPAEYAMRGKTRNESLDAPVICREHPSQGSMDCLVDLPFFSTSSQDGPLLFGILQTFALGGRFAQQLRRGFCRGGGGGWGGWGGGVAQRFFFFRGISSHFAANNWKFRGFVYLQQCFLFRAVASRQDDYFGFEWHRFAHEKRRSTILTSGPLPRSGRILGRAALYHVADVNVPLRCSPICFRSS